MLKIYKIIDNTNGNIYIGKTTQTLKKRLTQHKSHKNCMAREIIKNGDYKIELIEETEDETRERYWIENTECVNKMFPGRKHKEWYLLNKDRVISKSKTQYENNRDEILKIRKEYYESNIDKIKEYNKAKRMWYKSMGGNPTDNNMSLLKIDPNLFLY